MSATSEPALAQCVYRIDGENCFQSVDEGWCAFARENHGTHLLPDRVLGTSLWNYLTGIGTRYIYQKVLQYVRSSEEKLSFNFRCDAPAIQRTLRMDVAPLADGAIQFHTSTLQEESRPALELLNVDRARDSRIVLLCGWCMRAQDRGLKWVSLEEAAGRIEPADNGTLPELIHTVCPVCHIALRQRMPTPAETRR